MNLISRQEIEPAADGESFGRYRLRGVLGQGGMGRLYLAEQAGIQGFTKIVALKRLLPHLADSPQLKTMFLSEARIAARLEHPNIVATYELGEASGTYFIAMEYLPGEDLGDVLAACKRRPMPVELAAAISQQAGQGLNHAHELRDSNGRPLGLVHRDVNPSNIFLTYFGIVKVLDFGVVKGRTTTKTMPGVFKGNYAYCAPEQVEGRPVDRRTDVFSLGMVLWECLTGRRLITGDTDFARIEAVRTRPIPAPSVLRPDVPPELDRIALTALHRDRERRFQSVAQLCDALEEFLSGHRLRPTSQSLGDWLGDLFGNERATLKKTIAQGSEIEGSLARLQTLCDPLADPAPPHSTRARTVWSSGGQDEAAPVAVDPTNMITSRYDVPPALFEAASRPRSAPRGWRSPSPVRIALAIALPVASVALAAYGWTALRGPGPNAGAAAAVASAGALDLRTTPAGAAILVDGDPTGMTTPAVLPGLRAGHTVEVRLQKLGFQPVVRRLAIAAGEPRRHAFQLVASTGFLRLEDVPAKASVYLDGQLVDGSAAVAAPLGRHKLEVTVEGEVLLSRTLEVQAGEQTVRIGGAR